MTNNPVTKRELQESLDIFQGAMSDQFTVQDAKLETLGLRISEVDERLKSLQSGVAEIQNFVNERAKLDDERYDTVLGFLSNLNQQTGSVIKLVGHLNDTIAKFTSNK